MLTPRQLWRPSRRRRQGRSPPSFLRSLEGPSIRRSGVTVLTSSLPQSIWQKSNQLAPSNLTVGDFCSGNCPPFTRVLKCQVQTCHQRKRGSSLYVANRQSDHDRQANSAPLLCCNPDALRTLVSLLLLYSNYFSDHDLIFTNKLYLASWQ